MVQQGMQDWWKVVPAATNTDINTNTHKDTMEIQTYGKLLLRLPPPQPHALDLHNEGSLPLDQGLLQMGVKFGTKDARIPSLIAVA